MSAAMMTEMALATDPTLPAFFLGHLDSLAKRQATTTNPKERVALGIELFSVFLDCVELGLQNDAQQIMKQFHRQDETLAQVAA